jgi:hypothetical protein
MKRLSIIMALAALGMLLSVAPALAAAPTNDEIEGAVPIESLPSTHSTDTTEATSSPDDPDCAGTAHSVWYSLTAADDARLEVNTFGSDYDTVLQVLTGSPGDLSIIECNDDTDGLQSRVRFDAVAGQIYLVMASSFGNGPGGNLMLSADLAPPPLQAELTIDPIASFDRQGNAVITGTLTRSHEADAFISGNVRQRVGRSFIEGGFDSPQESGAGTTTWTATATGDGVFAGGRAEVRVFFEVSDGSEFVSDEVIQTVRLRRSR